MTLRPGRSLGDALDGDNNLTLIRLIAAGAVVFGHSFALSLNAAGQRDPVDVAFGFGHSGSLGVNIFFLISGLLISRSFARDPSLVAFCARRFVRIWPALAVCVGVTVLVGGTVFATVPAWDFLLTADWPAYFFQNIALLTRFDLDFVFSDRPHPGPNGALWTLPLEASLYGVVAAVGVVGLILRRHGAAADRAALLAAVVLVVLFASGLDRLSQIPIWHFLAGMLLYRVRDRVRPQLWHLGAALAVTIALAQAAAGPVEGIAFHALLGWSALWLAMVPMPMGWLRMDLSYGLYLYHFPIQQGVAGLLPALAPMGLFALSLPLAALCAWASWRWVEYGAIRAGRSFTGAGDWSPRAWRGLVRGLAVPLGLVLAFLTAMLAMPGPGEGSPLEARVLRHGPETVVAGTGFNVQGDGRSAMWVELDRPVPENAELVWAGVALDSKVHEGHRVTAIVPDRLFRTAGEKDVAVRVRTARGAMVSAPVTIRVTGAP